MNLLAFDTSTELLTVAVSTSAGQVREHEGVAGAEASATLLPNIQRLLAAVGLGLADLDAIVFGRGPGSFTGLRTACAVAQGLGFGANVPVLGVDTLTLVAEEARVRGGGPDVVALLDARMDEVYWAPRSWRDGRWDDVVPPALSKPEAVVVPAGWVLAGNALRAHATRLPTAARRIEARPTAAALLRLAPALLTAGQAVPAAEALPLYVRDKVAQTTLERAVHRAHKETAAPAAGRLR